MKEPSPTNKQSTGPTTECIVVAVILTGVAGIVLFAMEVAIAADYYSVPSLGTVIILFVTAITYSTILHPLIGLGVSRIIQHLTKLSDSVYRFRDEAWSNWNPGVSLVVGAAWPITMFAIPLLLVALVIGHVYRLWWRW
jgi:hypothetical protein